MLLRAFTDVFMTTDTLRTCQLFKDMTTLPTVFEARLPAFRPVPPKLQSREEVYLKDETSFECWLYVNSLALAAYRLCDGCGEEGDGRLRLPPKFPVVPLSQ